MNVSFIVHQLPVTKEKKEKFQSATADDEELRLVLRSGSARVAKPKEPGTKTHTAVLDI